MAAKPSHFNVMLAVAAGSWVSLGTHLAPCAVPYWYEGQGSPHLWCISLRKGIGPEQAAALKLGTVKLPSPIPVPSTASMELWSHVIWRFCSVGVREDHHRFSAIWGWGKVFWRLLRTALPPPLHVTCPIRPAVPLALRCSHSGCLLRAYTAPLVRAAGGAVSRIFRAFTSVLATGVPRILLDFGMEVCGG